MYRLDLGLYSHLKEFGGMESETMLTPKEKFPSPQRRMKPAMLHQAGGRGRKGGTIQLSVCKIQTKDLIFKSIYNK